jgi:hypothetical protein
MRISIAGDSPEMLEEGESGARQEVELGEGEQDCRRKETPRAREGRQRHRTGMDAFG